MANDKDKKEIVIHGFKGFNKDMTCRGFQYEVGKEYETDQCEPCESGFHACENPLDVLRYYPPSKSVFCKTEQCGEVKRHSEDSKVASTKIKIIANVGLKGILEAGFELIFSKIKWGKKDTPQTHGDSSAAQTHGNYSAASVFGEESIAVSTGYNGKAMGKLGSWFVLADWENGKINYVKSAKVDGKKIKADTWYRLENGKFKVAE